MLATDISPQHEDRGSGADSAGAPAWSSPFAAANLRLAEQQHDIETDGDDDDQPLVEDVGRVEVRLSRTGRADLWAHRRAHCC